MSNKKPQALGEFIASMSPMKILIPALLGVGVVGFMLWNKFDLEEFKLMSWNIKTLLFLIACLGIYVIRHLAYSWRLRILSDSVFSWNKCVELIFIWEFAAAISPTSLGGSATALLFLAQEKISAGKTVLIVLYSVVLDTLYFLISLLGLLFYFGPTIIRPGLDTVWGMNGYGFSFIIVFILMSTYGGFFYYGLFVNPNKIAGILKWVSKRKWLNRFEEYLKKTADDVIIAAKEMKNKSISFHFYAFLSTTIAWLMKFAAIPLIVFAIIQTIPPSVYDFGMMLGRNEIMFAITAFSPTPGGAGVVEVLFGGFFSDYIVDSSAVIIAFIWRLITYYSYLFIGMIIVPFWIRKIVVKRRSKK